MPSKRTVTFTPPNVSMCIEVDLRYPENRDRFTEGEIRRRLFRGLAGIHPDTVLKVVVSAKTPVTEIELPDGVRMQLSVPSQACGHRWLEHIRVVAG